MSKTLRDKLAGSGWIDILGPLLASDEYQKPREVLIKRYQDTEVYPKRSDIFRAFVRTPLDTVKVVILGQDPYHGPNQANGLAFAVNNGIPRPPSLRNIIKEVESDLSISIPSDASDLTGWAKQGVLLLNSILTVEKGSPDSHGKIGWDMITDGVLLALSKQNTGIIFVLWGEKAQSKRKLLGYSATVLEAAHPSPQSAYSGFFGCNHFSKINQHLESIGKSPIDWSQVDRNSTNDIGRMMQAMGLIGR